MLILPGIILEIAFSAGLLYFVGGPSRVGREAFMPVLGGFVLALLVLLLPALRRWRDRGVVVAAAAVLVIGSIGLALALPDGRTAALSLILGSMGIVLLGLTAAVVEIATGRQM